MKMFTVFLVFISLVVILNNSIVIAQDGNSKIQGKVTDAGTGEPLFGANIILTGTSLGAASDMDGEYQITNVPPGTYTIQYTYIGYKNYKAETVKVLPGKTVVLNAKLTLESLEGQTVVVTAQKQGQISAINQQLSSNSIKDIVAKDWIEEVPDVNAAESIGRLPGVSLQRDGGEGNKIVIRGLSPKYNNVQIDGVQMTGVDADRSVGLSIVQDEMLEGIELSKSLTPDMDADALGGTVNLTMKTADPGYHFQANVAGAYNNYRNDYSNYKLGIRISNRFFDNSLGIIGNFGTEKNNRSTDHFGAGYNKYIPAGQAAVIQDNWAEINQTIDERFRSFGAIVLDYQSDFMKLKMDNSLSQQMDENTWRENFFQLAGSSNFQPQIYNSKPISTIRSHSLSGVFSIFNTELKLEGSYSRTTYNNYQDQYNFVDNDLIPAIAPATLINAQPGSIISEFYNITAPKTADMNYNLMITSATKDETNTYKADWKIPYNITSNISGNVKVGGFYSYKLRNSNTDQLDGPYVGGRGEQYISYAQTNNIVPGLLYNHDVNIPHSTGIPAQNFQDLNYDWGNILGGRYHLGYTMDMAALDRFSHIWYNAIPAFVITDGQQTYQNDYNNNERKTAAYLMTELHIGENLMLLPGIRYEKFHSGYTGYFIQTEPEALTGVQYIKPVTSINNNEYWFPSINTKYTLNEWSDFRAAYYASCTRPDYIRLSPGVVADAGKVNLIAYNPYLKPATANNIDVIYSFHSNEIGLLSIAGFYKEIKGLITTLPSYQPQFYDKVQNAPGSLIAELQAPRALYDPNLFKQSGQTLNNFPVNNPENTYFRGIELNWETNFWYLPGLLSNLILDVNYTHIWSSTQNPYLNIVNGFDTSGARPKPISIPYYTTRQSRMVDQPADIWNIRVGWDYKGFSTRVSFRYQGETLTGLDPQNSLTDSYSKAQFIMDWSMKQDLYYNLSFLADVSNINQYIDDSYIKTGGYSFPTGSNSYGLVVDVGLRYEY